MADSGHFGFPALPKFPRTLKTGIGAYFVTNTLKYNKKPSNFVSQRLVTKSLILTLLLVKGRNVIRSITRACVICRRKSRARPQMMGQLPAERVTPGSVLDKVGVNYAGPIYTKIGAVRRPTIVKSVFVSLSVKAIHLEAVSDLSADAFLACLRRFTAGWGKPVLIWSDHGTNFTGTARLLSELHQFLHERDTERIVASFCTSQGTTWDFIPEHAPHYGGLWEAAVKSTKKHLSRIVGNARLSFEELTTVLCQIEAAGPSFHYLVMETTLKSWHLDTSYWTTARSHPRSWHSWSPHLVPATLATLSMSSPTLLEMLVSRIPH